MKSYKLEKNIKLYKSQFDNYMYQILGDYRLDRLSIEIDSIMFRIKYMLKHKKDLHKIPQLKREFTSKGLELRNCFGEFLYNFMAEIVTIPEPFHLEDIKDILSKDVNIDSTYVTFQIVLISDNKEYLEYVDKAIDSDEVYNLNPTEYFRFFTDSYNDGISKAFPELFENRYQYKIGTGADGDIYCHNFTFQVLESCSLSCTYCLAAGTKITMSDFTLKNIEDVQKGDEVLSIDEFHGPRSQHKIIKSEVIKLYNRKANGYYKITHPELREPILLTGEHPICSYRYGWLPIEKLSKRDKILILNPDPYDFYDVDINNINYIKGYFIAAFMGDGCILNRVPTDGFRRYFMRFVVKDEEMNIRMRTYAKILGFTFRTYPFKISEKYNIWRDAIGSCKKSDYDRWMTLLGELMYCKKFTTNNMDFLMGFSAGLYDAEGNIYGSTVRIVNTNQFLLDIVCEALNRLNIKFTYDMPGKVVNKEVYILRLVGGSGQTFKFIRSCKPAIIRKGIENIYGKSYLHYIENYNIEYIDGEIDVYNFETTSHTYAAGRLMVHNCYQHNKSPMSMDFNTAKTFIDHLLNDDYGYINRYNSPAIIIEFIGGEPLLAIELIREIYEYFIDRCYELDHPWFMLHRVSICSNGLQYFDDEVQSFFKDYSSQISFNISIDGNKELHDSCRIQPNGEGSYDVAMAALNHYNENYTPERNSKMTLAPENISHLYDSVVNFINNGMSVININCVFEEGWNKKTALIEYQQLKKLADYLLENDLENLYIAVFNERQEDMISKEMDSSSCGGGSGSMLSLRPNGEFYPCIRYMPSSIGDDIDSVCIGTVKDGLIGRKENSRILYEMDRNTRRSQTNDICYNCPIGTACHDCSALGYEIFNSFSKKTTFACIQVIAECLANVYYWNLLSIKHPEYKLPVRKNNVPDEWALLVIDEEELNYLKAIESYAMIVKIENE